MLSNQMTVVPLTTLRSHETREELEKWWGILKCQMKTTKYKEVMYKTWTAKNDDARLHGA